MNESNDDGQEQERDLFFTTSDLLNKINGVVDREHKKVDENNSCHPRFELQRRFKDGTTRKASAEETAAADFQSKLKQAAILVNNLTNTEKLVWADKQRQEGNKLFAKARYKEAMDVYLTCLVASEIKHSKDVESKISEQNSIDLSSTSDQNVDGVIETSIGKVEDDCWEKRVENEIKFPILLNLSLCTLKMSMYKKTCTFCDLALELQCGKRVPKVYYRRGKARIHIGEYTKARDDLKFCFKLLSELERNEEVVEMEHTVTKELTKLSKIIINSEKNRARQERAMKKMLGGMPIDDLKTQDDATSKTVDYARLYNGIKKNKDYSTLRAPRRYKKQSQQQPQLVYVQKHINLSHSAKHLLEVFLRKILFLLGDEDAMKKAI